MKKQFVLLYMAVMMILFLTACQTKTETETKEAKQTKEKIILNVRNPKVEISTQFEQMANAYEKENPHIDIKIHTVGGAADDLSDLKAQIASGTGPDIFTNNGYENAKLWSKYLEDLSDQPWVDKAYKDTLTPMKINGKIYGMPFNLEGYGFIYNKDLFKQAGIDELPKTLTELIAAAEKLQQAGIMPFANGYYEEWKLGDQLVSIAFAQQEDPVAFINALNHGIERIETNQRFKDVINVLDVTLKYGNKNPLTTDYNMELNLFANGQAAIIQQGNWIQPLIDQLTPNMNIGIMPIPINDERNNDSLVVGVPNYWVINKQTTPIKKKEAKKFLTWMVTSPQGKTYLTDHFKFIPAFENMEADNLGPLADEIIHYSKAGKTFSINWFHFPVGVRAEFSSAMQLYVGKQLNRDQLLQEFQKSWENAASQ
ncbi:ABC transporter substrate-binding protein [uncultured Metabacillus sp.]|uniref:ABC transporter substrate-binding protein n=1 Tax=uncultured Metabacillus sp. TaxID=2860135 RepID=UPI0026023ABC|nr:ABC transporter substrate-binding protein [uncultured Metabacillus sp.]